MKIIFSYILLFLLIFDLHFPGIKFLGSAPLVLAISPFIYIFIHKEQEHSFLYLLNNNKYIIISFSLIVIYTGMRMLFGGENPPIFLLSVIKNTLYVIAGLIYLTVFQTKKLPIMLLNIFFINSIICIVAGTYTELLPYIFTFKGDDLETEMMWIPYRNSFLAGSGYFGIGSVYALASSFFLIYFFDSKQLNVITILKILTCAFVGFIAARTSMFTFLLTVSFLVIIKKKYKLLLALVILIIILLVILPQIIEIDESQQEWFLEIISNYNQLDQTGSGAVLLRDMIVLPKTFIGLIFGDGYYALGDLYYGGTDIGYLRHWLFGGIILVFLVFLIPFAFYIQNKNRNFIFLIVPVILILHFKGVFLLNNPMGMPLLFLISHILQEENLHHLTHNNEYQTKK